MAEIALLLVGVGVGAVAGYFIGKSKAAQSADLSNQMGLVSDLKSTMVEIKTKFEEVEKSREKLDDVKEKRTKEWMENTQKLFNEQSQKGLKSDEEKEKRIKEWMEQTKKFFGEQKESTIKFLEAQGKTREEIEEKRDAQIKDMNHMVSSFTRAVSGTKKRGMLGEELLKDVLSNSIKAGLVKLNLKTGNGEVEFAWNLDDGKYIPIDCKLPDVFKLLDEYNETDDLDEQKSLKKKIVDKIKKEVKTVQKYQNLSNTIDSCILVVPEGILEISPEIVSLGQESNVFVCTYKDVFPIAHVLQEQHIRLKEEGDIGEYKRIIKSLFQIMEKISKKTEAIERGFVMIKNANENIQDELVKGRRQKLVVDSE